MGPRQCLSRFYRITVLFREEENIDGTRVIFSSCPQAREIRTSNRAIFLPFTFKVLRLDIVFLTTKITKRSKWPGIGPYSVGHWYTIA